MKTVKSDQALPALPIPELTDTCQSLKQMIKPLVDRKQWEETCCLLDQFSEEGGAGEKLQQLLQQWKAGLPVNSSWLRPIWEDKYLSYRGSLPMNLNYCLQLSSSKDAGLELARWITGLCYCIRQLKEGSLSPEMSKSGYMSMDMLAHVIYTRIPGKIKDIPYAPSLSDPMTAAVVCQGHWFILSLTDHEGEIISPGTIQSAFNQIRIQTENLVPANPVGAMTTFDRGQACSLRESLQETLLNRLSLGRIENALFVVCLDEFTEDEKAVTSQILGGDAANRWYDKSLQIIFTGNRMGLNFEHSGCDASIWSYLLAQTEGFLSEQSYRKQDIQGAPQISLLEWDIADAPAERLKNARDEFFNLTNEISISQRKLRSVSKELIKSKNCSPDAFVQLLFQASYYKLTGCFRSVYEAVSTRKFYQGRTDCVRSCTEESVTFIEALVRHREKTILQQLFRSAEASHKKQVRQSQNAYGAERHMAGLSAMRGMYQNTQKGVGLEDTGFLDSAGYQALCKDTLSTSSITGPSIDFFGFAPVVADGLGIGYGLKEDALQLMVSSYKKSGIEPEEFIHTLEETAEEFFRIL